MEVLVEVEAVVVVVATVDRTQDILMLRLLVHYSSGCTNVHIHAIDFSRALGYGKEVCVTFAFVQLDT